jgi:hypothetical protein
MNVSRAPGRTSCSALIVLSPIPSAGGASRGVRVIYRPGVGGGAGHRERSAEVPVDNAWITPRGTSEFVDNSPWQGTVPALSLAASRRSPVAVLEIASRG